MSCAARLPAPCTHWDCLYTEEERDRQWSGDRGQSLGVWLYELLWDWQDQECAVPVDVVVRTDRCGY